MLFRITNEPEIQAAQQILEHTIRNSLPTIGVTKVGFRGGQIKTELFSKGSGNLWCAFEKLENNGTPRYWNSFGTLDTQKSQQIIVVEINVPISESGRSVAGYFAKCLETGKIFLVHTGKIGGGKKGIGKSSFLEHCSLNETDIFDGRGSTHKDILIGQIDSVELSGRILRFVRKVKEFKESVDQESTTDIAGPQPDLNWPQSYNPEGSGRRTGRVEADLDYISYHGDVVDALKQKLESPQSTGQNAYNNKFVDLWVTQNGFETGFFEIKTNRRRQTLYTAIGQILTYSNSCKTKVSRTLVIPAGEIPRDIISCLNEEGIEILRYRIEGEHVIFEEDPNIFQTTAELSS